LRTTLRVLGNGYWILVVDVAPVKLAVLDFFDLVLGVGTATEDLGAFPAVRVDAGCLITVFAKLTDMSHLNHDPSCLGLTQISRFPGLSAGNYQILTRGSSSPHGVGR
jgi:hypothetical protein